MALASVSGNISRICMSLALGLAVIGCDGGSVDVEPVALAGTIDIEAGTRVDVDNADALLGRAPLTPAQRLPPEFILAGYVSDAAQSGTYPPLSTGSDRFEFFPDRIDQYVSPLQAGLELTLQSFATRFETASDLQLTVKTPDGDVLAEKTALRNGAPVTIALDSDQTGDYTLSVTALGAAPMLYILSSSRTEISNAAAYDWPRHEFVEDEAIVSIRDPANADVSASSPPTSALMVPGRQIAPGLWTVRPPSTVSVLGRGSPAKQTLEWIRRLRDDPAIRHASPNYRTHALSPLNEPLYASNVLGQQWHYSLINGPIAWQLAPGGGAGVNVAVLDTGLFRNNAGAWHPDLADNLLIDSAGNLLTGFDAVDGGAPADTGNAVGGSVYHGTHVAGTVAAVANGRGGAGVAFNASLMPVRVLGEGGSGSLTDLLEAMQWVLGDSSEARPPAEIVNLSLGGLPCGTQGVAETLQQLINQGVAKGIVYVAAAGNSASTEPSCPAALDNVFSVSAVDGAGNLASYSNSGSTIDLAAPGGDASRDGNGDGQGDLVSSSSAAVVDGQLQAVYRGLQGTSMAAPHVSGALALMKGIRPELDYFDIKSYLESGEMTVPPCATPCRTNQFGYGVLDAAKAVQAVLSGSPSQLLSSSPAVVNLTTEANVPVTRPLELSPLGNHDITVTDVSVSDDWFAVSVLPQNTISAGTSARLELALVPDNLEAGLSARGDLQITYDSGSESQAILTVPVIGQKITDQQARNAGRHFVLLVRPEPVGEIFETVAQTAVTTSNGQYRFEFLADDGAEPRLQNEVPPGEYILIAGTDLDNDGLICHEGEACAEYPVAGLREVIEVQKNQAVTGIRMTTSYFRPTLSGNSPDMLPRPDFKGYRRMSEQSGTQSTSTRAVQTP